MKDSTVCIFIVMSIIFIVLTGVAASQTDLTNLDISYDPNVYPNWIIYAITQGALFSASIYIVLAGVRMMVAEIVPAFKGFAKKIVPNAKPAVDCPIVFPYAPNAVMIGFLMSFLGVVVAMLILISINTNLHSILVPVIVPGVVSHFFCGGSAGAFANAQGGTRGCVIGSFIHGIFISILSLLVMPLIGGLNLSGTTFSDSDFCLTGILFGGLSNIISSTGVFILCTILFIIPILIQQFKSKNTQE